MSTGWKGNGWIGVDLDGTLAHYDKWRGVDHIGEPIPIMIERVKRWIANGIEIRIFTARVAGPNRDEAKRPILDWCFQHLGFTLPITNVKDYDMLELWDDRAVQIEQNTGRIIGKSTRGLI